MEEKVKAIVERWLSDDRTTSLVAMREIAELVKPKRIVFEYVGDRFPKAGEHFFVAGRIEVAHHDFIECKFPVYRAVEGAEHLK